VAANAAGAHLPVVGRGGDGGRASVEAEVGQQVGAGTGGGTHHRRRRVSASWLVAAATGRRIAPYSSQCAASRRALRP